MGALSLCQIVVPAFKQKQVFKYFFFRTEGSVVVLQNILGRERESQSCFTKDSDLCDSERDNLLLSHFNL